MRIKRIIAGIVILELLFLVYVPAYGQDISNSPETIAVLQELYKAEVIACRLYSAFARRAMEENYGSVATLFIALRTSESIHARNFRNLIVDLGAEVPAIPEFGIIVFSTKQNLKFILTMELAEIDGRYPVFLERAKRENYEPALKDITNAWKAEEQHRDLVRKMYAALPFFFGKIVKKLKETGTFFICHGCGSTLTELPADVCPVCSNSISMYKEVDVSEWSSTRTKNREGGLIETR